MPATIKDIAKHAGVSFSTVAAVLAQRPIRVGQATRERILQIAEKLHYEPSNLGRSLRSGHSHLVACLSPHFNADLLLDALLGLEVQLQNYDYHLVLMTYRSPGEFRQRLQQIRQQRIDGVVYPMLRDHQCREMAAELAATIPSVVLFGTCPGIPAAVFVDGEAIIRIGMEYLLGLGHRRIAIVGDRPSAKEIAPAVMEAFGLPPEQLLFWPEMRLFEEGPTILARLRATTPHPTALFCYSDSTAAGFLQAAVAAGLRIPDEISVLGVNNDAFSAFVSPALTTVAQPRQGQGENAAFALLALMRGEKCLPETILHPYLLQRASCAPPA